MPNTPDSANLTICVFAGSSPGARPEYTAAASALGKLLGKAGIRVIYGGGNIGLMGELADATLLAGGRIIGVIPEALVEKELAHQGLTKLIIVRGMHDRKARMAELANAFIALPGGAGTLEELFEVWTWSQLGYHNKPIGILNIAGYYEPLITLIDHLVAERFLNKDYRQQLCIASEPEELLKLVRRYVAPAAKWADRRKFPSELT